MNDQSSIPDGTSFLLPGSFMESLRMTVSYRPFHVKKSLTKWRRRPVGSGPISRTQSCRQDAGATVRIAKVIASPRRAGRAYNRSIPGHGFRIEAAIGEIIWKL